MFSVLRGIAFVLAIVLSPLAFAQQGPANLNVSGGLFLPSGLPVTSSSVNFRLEIWDKAATCMLYTEDHLAQNLSASKGGFSLAVGLGANANNLMESTTALSSKIFENNGAIAGGWANCPSGANLAPGDDRLIRVFYDLGGGFVAMSPDVPIASAAYAMVAETLQGKRPSDLIQVKDDVTTDLTQANVENVFSSTNYARLQQLLNPSAAIGFGSQRLTNLANPSAAQDAATKNYTDTNLAGQTIDLVDVAPGFGGGKVLTWDSAAGKWVAQAPAIAGTAGGDLSGSYPNPTIAALAVGTSKLANDAVTSAKINSTGIATNRLLVTDATTGATVTYANCSNNEILKYVTGTGWQCATVASLSAVTSVAGKSGDVALNAADIGGLGTAAVRDIGTAATEVPELDAGGKLAASTIPLFAGDVTGAIGANIVTQIQGREIANTLPNLNEVLRWNGSRWEPQALTDNVGITALNGDITAEGPGLAAATINNGAVTTSKMFATPGANRLVATDSTTGATLTAFTCNLNETMQWTAAGWACVDVSSLVGTGYVVNNGNTLGAPLTVGTNDAQPLRFETNNIPKMTVLSTGEVGIGTTSPSQALQVQSGNLLLESAGSPKIMFNDPAGTNIQKIQFNRAGAEASAIFNNSSNQLTYLTTNTDHVFKISNSTVAMRILGANGNVGIGTSAPNRLLEVAGPVRIAPAALPGTPGAGDMAIDSGAGNALKYYNGSNWISLAVGGTGDFKADGTVAMTGAFRSIAGNAGAPGMTFVGDTANGIFAPAANTFGVSTSGTEKLRVTSAGNVGIGTTTPNTKLEVDGNIRLTNGGELQAANNSNLTIKTVNNIGNVILDSADTVQVNLRDDADGLRDFRIDSVGVGTPFFVNGETAMVGIGTSAPNRLLEVAGPVRIAPAALPGTPGAGDMAIDSGAGNALKYYNGSSWISLAVGGTGDFKADGSVAMTGAFRSIAGNAGAPGMTFVGDTANGIFAPAANTFGVATAGSERLRISNTGNVGVGTTNPSAKLDVNGQIAVLSGSSANPSIFVTGQTNTGVNLSSPGNSVALTVAGSDKIIASSVGVGISGTLSMNNGGTASSAAIRQTGDATTGIYWPAAGKMSFTTAGNDTLFLANGNVGIGTTAPNRLLEVAGPVRIAPTALPGTPGAGDMAIDSGAGNALKYYNGSSWISLAVGGTGDFKADGTVAMTGAFRSIAGNAGAPGMTFVGDTDNGLFAPSADILAIGTAGSERMRVNALGNVGIGITGPLTSLHVVRSGSSNAAIFQSPNGGSGIRIDSAAGAFGASVSLSKNNLTRWEISANAATESGSNVGSDYLITRYDDAGAIIDSPFRVLRSSGYVGLGISTTPSRQLHVGGPMRLDPGALPGTPGAGDMAIDSGAGNALKYYNGSSWISLAVGGTGDFKADGTVAMTGAFRSIAGNAGAPGMTFVGDTANGIFAPAANTFGVSTSGSERLRVTSAGNVGIGTTAPAQALDVAGSVNASTSLIGPLVTSDTGAALTVQPGPASGTTATTGNALIVRSGPGGTTSGNGGTLSLGSSPGSGTVYNGGTVNLFTGGGGSSGNGGAMNITTGSATGTGYGGALSITSGNGNGGAGGSGGAISISGGTALGTGTGGAVTISGGLGGTAALAGGAVTVKGGEGSDNGPGGTATLSGGNGGSSSGAGGPVNISGGIPVSGAGGSVNVTATAGVGSNQNGGNVVITSGAATGSGAPGTIQLMSNVGIGTTSPNRLLEIAGPIRVQPGVLPAGAAGDLAFDSSGNALKFHNGTAWQTVGTSSATGDINNGGNNGAIVIGSNDSTLKLETNNATAVTILADGKVGIGTTSPGYAVDITGAIRSSGQVMGSMANMGAGTAANPSYSFLTGPTIGMFSPSAGVLGFGTSSTERMRILANGNVGIGTTNPTAALEVAGTAKATAVDTPSILSNGIEAIHVNTTASGVNYIAVTPATTTNGPILSTGGSDATIPLNIYSKGGGAILMAPGQAPAFKANFVPSSVNYLQVQGATAGNSPVLSAAGADANVDILLTPKGSGRTVVTSGNFGIGTTAPARLLNVAGPMRLDPATLPVTPGAGDIAVDSGAGNVLKWYNGSAWQTVGTSSATGDINNGGNAFGAAATIGTNDGFALNLETNNTKRLTVTSTGEVGIGTTSPSGVFQVNRDQNGDTSARVANYDSGGGATSTFGADSDAAWTHVKSFSAANGGASQLYGTGTSLTLTANAGTAPIKFETGGANERMRITNTGNVGIGTTSPSDNLSIENASGTANLGLRVRGDNSALRSVNINFSHENAANVGARIATTRATGDDYGMNMKFFTQPTTGGSAQERMRISADGNVGIGMSLPARLLSVAGPMRLDPTALPGAPGAGDIAIDSGAGNVLKWYNGSAWQTVGTSSATGDINNGGNSFSGIVNVGTNDNFALNLETNNQPRLTATGGGNVGVGTTAPSAKFSVGGAASDNAYFFYDNANVGGTTDGQSLYLYRRAAGNDAAFRFYIDQYREGYITDPIGNMTHLHIGTEQTNAYLDLQDQANGNVTMFAKAVSGETPSLEISGFRAGDALRSMYIAVGDTAANTASFTGVAKYHFDGNVGIGTSTPARLLNVAGPMRLNPTALPGTPAAGDIAIDSGASNALKYHNGTNWVSIGSGTGDFLANGSVPMTGNLRLNNHWLSGDGGNEGVFVDSTGKVGVGTTSPSTLLSLGGTTGVANGLSLGSGDFKLYQPAAGELTFQLGGADRWFMNAGNWYTDTGTGPGFFPVDTAIVRTRYDENSGLGRVGADSAALVTAGAYRLTATSTGDVGIGTTAPLVKLHIVGTDNTLSANGSIVGVENLSTATHSISGFAAKANNGAVQTDLLSDGLGTSPMGIIGGGAGTLTNHAMSIFTNSLPRIVVSNSGSVGIGTTSAARLLHVNGPMRLEPAALPGTPAAGDIAIDSGASNALKYHNGSAWVSIGAGNTASAGSANYISKFNGANSIVDSALYESAGNVGIGTTSPSALLDVRGGDFIVWGNGSQLKLKSTGGGDRVSIGNNGGSNGVISLFNSSAAKKAEINANGDSYLNGGNVGIGTTSPSRLLQVAGPIRITPTVNPAAPAAGDMFIDSAASNALKYYDGSAWVSASGGGAATPAGANRQIQFNNSGVMGASSNLNFVNTGDGQLILGSAGLTIGDSLLIRRSATDDANIRLTNSTTGFSGSNSGFEIELYQRDLELTNHENGYVALSTNDLERMRITAAGNVGIGTTSPSNKLSVVGDADVEGAFTAGYTNSAGPTQALAAINYAAAAADNGAAITFVGHNGTTGMSTITSGWNAATNTNSYLTLSTRTASAVTEKVRITSAGNVGIGTTAPSRLLQVAGPMKLTPAAIPGTPTAGDIVIDSGGANTLKYYNGSAWVSAGGGGMTGTLAPGEIAFGDGSGNIDGSGSFQWSDGTQELNLWGSINMYSVGGPWFVFHRDDTNVVANDTLGQLMAGSEDSNADSPFIQVKASAAHSGTANGNYIQLLTTPDTSTTAAVRMQINSDGKVGIGTTSPAYPLTVGGNQNSALGIAVNNTNTGNAAESNFFIGKDFTTTWQAGALTYRGSGFTPSGNINPNQFEIISWSGATNGMLVGPEGNAPLKFMSNNTERVRILAGGNVGIGTTTPTRLLQVAGPMKLTPAAIPGTPTAGDIVIDSGASNALKYYNGSAWVSAGGGGSPSGVGGAIQFSNGASFASDASNIFFDDTNNRLGIGTSAPASNLTVVGAGEPTVEIASSDNTNYLNPLILMKRSRGTPGTKTNVAAGDSLFEMVGQGYYGGTYYNAGAINMYVDDVPGANDMPTRIDISTAADGSATLTERVTIKNNGFVGIGTTSPNSTLDVSSATGDGNILISSSATNANAVLDLWSRSGGVTKYSSLVADWTGNLVMRADTGLYTWRNGADSADTMSLSDTGLSIGSGAATARVLNTSGAIRIAPTAAPGTPAAGDIFVDSSASNALKYYDGSAWVSAGGGGAGGLPAANGTVGTPSINFTNSTGMGFYRIGANVLGVATAGVNRMSINASGNIGIGKTNQSEKLDVNGNVRATQMVVGTAGAFISDAGSLGNLTLNPGGTGVIETGWGSAFQVNDGSGNPQIKLIGTGNSYFNNGNVGIGTTNPASPLHVSTTATGDNSPILNFAPGLASGSAVYYLVGRSATANDSGFIGYVHNTTQANRLMAIGHYGSGPAMVVKNDGKVGIGLINPSRLLQVEGPMKITPTTAPSSPTAGDIFVDSTASNTLKVYNGSTWVSAAGGGSQWTTSGSNIYSSNTGNVGIGTSTPPAKLTLQTAPGGGFLMLGGSDPAAAVAAPYLASQVTSGFSSLPVYSFWYQDTTGISNPANNSMGFVTNGGERMRISSAGNVGIGTTSPGSPLEVMGPIRGGGLILNGTGFTVATGMGAPASNTLALNTGGLERLRIDSSGNVGIGVTNPSVALDVNGDIEYTGTITDVSDRRLKENITPLDNSLAMIRELPVYSYTMKGDKKQKAEYGVMAQDLRALVPNLTSVIDPEHGYIGVNYIGLIPWSIRAIQEVDREVASVKAENADLKSRVEKLEQQNRVLSEQVQKLIELHQQSGK